MIPQSVRKSVAKAGRHTSRSKPSSGSTRTEDPKPGSALPFEVFRGYGELGTREELIELGGLYAAVWSVQTDAATTA